MGGYCGGRLQPLFGWQVLPCVVMRRSGSNLFPGATFYTTVIGYGTLCGTIVRQDPARNGCFVEFGNDRLGDPPYARGIGEYYTNDKIVKWMAAHQQGPRPANTTGKAAADISASAGGQLQQKRVPKRVREPPVVSMAPMWLHLSAPSFRLHRIYHWIPPHFSHMRSARTSRPASRVRCRRTTSSTRSSRARAATQA